MRRYATLACWIALLLSGCRRERPILVDETTTDCILLDSFAGGSAAGRPRFEVCNNGVDDDGNGHVDEGCVCVIGQELDCHPSADVAGIGVCARGIARCGVGSATGVWSTCEGAVAAGVETCDGFDEDCDASVDEGCDCERGTTQPCFPGAREALGVGECVAGEQRCVADPSRSIDGVIAYAWGACVGATLAAREQCNGLDDDCDGVIDDRVELCNHRDDDCDGDIDEEGVCAVLPAAYVLTRFGDAGGGGVLAPEAPLYEPFAVQPAEVADFACTPEQVIVEEPMGVLQCAPWPPACPDGQQAIWAESTWICVPCDVLVQFGALFASERTCAPRPDLSCPPGEVPTYGAESRAWRCLPECRDTTYDRTWLDGALVCVPC